MRRFLLSAVLTLAGLGLAGCGSTTPPVPAAGDLLGAPSQLNFSGRVVQVQAAPTVVNSTVKVTVTVRTQAAALPPMRLTDAYLVVDGAVWQAPVRALPFPNCGGRCLTGVAGAAAPGVRAGRRVPVIVRVLDAQGRPHLLRGGSVAVQAAPRVWNRP